MENRILYFFISVLFASFTLAMISYINKPEQCVGFNKIFAAAEGAEKKGEYCFTDGRDDKKYCVKYVGEDKR